MVVVWYIECIVKEYMSYENKNSYFKNKVLIVINGFIGCVWYIL